MHRELRELACAADADRRLVILRAAGETGSAGLDVLRVRVDLGDDSARHQLARRLARAGHLDELRERADSGDDYARYWLAEGPDEP
jgi:enoyl-CoA hydratase/carnithine racemase